MPRPSRICNKEGCSEIVIGANYCDEHKRPAWQGSTRASQKPPGWQRIRLSVMLRDSNTCVYCGAKATEVDHVIPVSRGGSHALSNLVASCTTCNQKKNHQQRTQN